MNITELKTIGVIGAGTMGSGIAQVLARAGYAVVLVDVDPAMLQRAQSAMAKSLARLVEKGQLEPAKREELLQRITVATPLDSVAGAELVIEAIVEDLDIKRRLLRSLDSMMRVDAVLASNTSSISITALAAATNRADRVVGMHFMNPVPVMPLVELIRGQATSSDTMQLAGELCQRIGKTSVEAADYPGFIANRILLPMINEAVYAVMEGVGTPEAIDTVMKLGMNHPMGPLALADLIGLDICLAIMNVLHEGFGDSKYRPCPLLRRMVAAGRLGRKSGQGFFTY